MLFSDYSAQFDFFFEGESGSVSGTAVVSKADSVRIDVTSPDPFTGICAETSFNGENNLFSVSFSGIKAELPADTVEKISLISGVFSNGTAAQLKSTPADKFVKCDEIFELDGIGVIDAYTVSKTERGTDYDFYYDRNTGYPVYICVKNGDSRAEIKIKKIKIKEG